VSPAPEIEAGYSEERRIPWRLIRLTFGECKIGSIESLPTRISTKRWRLHKLDLPPVIYPAEIPPADPRYGTYMSKRAAVLYPLDGSNNTFLTINAE